MIEGGGLVVSSESGDVLELRRHRETVAEEERARAESEDSENTGPMPSRVGRYIVLDTIGVGGMGVVCTAYDPKLDRKVALKLLRRGRDQRRVQTSRARLLREAQALAKLSHPNIVTVHDVETHQGQLYIAMEYVEGQSLDEWLLSEPREWKEIVDVFVRAGRGLAAAHAAGITHRDFKPGNVQIGNDGRVRVLDFGLAKNNDDDGASLDPADSMPGASRDSGVMELLGSTHDLKLTQVGRTVGTPAYMAPEQFHGLPVGPQTDQFAFGVSLFEALFSRLPFAEQDEADFVERVCKGKLREPPSGGAVPGWVSRVVFRMLARKPDERFASMDAAMVALTSDPAKRRQRWLVGLGMVGLVGLSGYAVMMLVGERNQPCSGAQERLVQVWGPQAQQRVQTAFEGTATPYAEHAWGQVSAALDDWGARWVEHHTEVCMASVRGEQSDTLMDLRMACLDRGRAELAGLVGVFEEADTRVVQQAVAAAGGLADIDRCPSAQPEEVGALPADPTEAERARAIETQRAEAEANILGGRYDKAVTLAQQAHAGAVALGHPPTLARANKALGTAYQHVRRDEEAATALADAVRMAAAAGLPEEETRAWSMLIYVEGEHLGRMDDALAKRLAAETALARAGSPKAAAASLAGDLGVVLSRAGKTEDALVEHRRAAELWRSVGSNQGALATVLNNLGFALARDKQLWPAREALEEALTIQRSLHGDQHPTVASHLFNLGHVLRELGAQEDARASYGEAIAILTTLFGPEHPAIAPALLGLAKVEEHDDRDAAIERAIRAVGLLEKAPGRRLAAALSTLAGLRTRAGEAIAESDPEGARAQWRLAQVDLQRIVTLSSKASGSTGIVVDDRLCRLAVLLDEPEQGRRACESALAALDAKAEDGEPVTAGTVDVLFDYARLLPAEHRAERLLLADAAMRWHVAHGSEPERIAELRLFVAALLEGDPDSHDAAVDLAERVRDAEGVSAQRRAEARRMLGRL